jgi:hypothetical protein
MRVSPEHPPTSHKSKISLLIRVEGLYHEVPIAQVQFWSLIAFSCEIFWKVIDLNFTHLLKIKPFRGYIGEFSLSMHLAIDFLLLVGIVLDVGLVLKGFKGTVGLLRDDGRKFIMDADLFDEPVDGFGIFFRGREFILFVLLVGLGEGVEGVSVGMFVEDDKEMWLRVLHLS